jgi:hypothetical protein
MFRAMLRYVEPSPAPNSRRTRGRAAARGGLACVVCLFVLVSFAAVGALAGPAVGGRVAGKSRTPGDGTGRSASAEGTTTPGDGSSTQNTISVPENLVRPSPPAPAPKVILPAEHDSTVKAPIAQAPPVQTTPVQTAPVQTPAVEGPLVVTMTASPDVVSVGQTVTYTADVSGVPPGKQVLYHWAFDGGTGVGQEITRTYPDAGEYPVAVTVTVASIAGLSGVADALTVVVSDSSPSSGSGNSSTVGGGAGDGKGGGGTGSGSSKAAHAPTRSGKATAPQGVPSPLPSQAPSGQGGVQVEGFLLTDPGVPFAPPTSTTPASSSSSAGGFDGGSAGVGSAAGIGGGVALTLAIITLGALDERRRISLRNA